MLAPPTNSALFRELTGLDERMPVVTTSSSEPPPPAAPEQKGPPSFGAPMDAMPLEEFERLRAANYAKGESPGRRIGPEKKTKGGTA